jgi:hypothetical protein
MRRWQVNRSREPDRGRRSRGAHEKGIIPRGLQDHQRVVTPKGAESRCLDFGLAKRLRARSCRSWTTRSDDGSDRGARPLADRRRPVAGTLHYLAPELLRGKPATSAPTGMGVGVLARHEPLAAPGAVQRRHSFEVTSAILSQPRAAALRGWRPPQSIVRPLAWPGQGTGERYQHAPRARGLERSSRAGRSRASVVSRARALRGRVVTGRSGDRSDGPHGGDSLASRLACSCGFGSRGSVAAAVGDGTAFAVRCRSQNVAARGDRVT